VRHLSDVIRRYAQAEFADADALAIQLYRHGNGAAAKRIGYLVEVVWPSAEVVVRQALALRSAGVIKLDPAVREKGDLIKRWGLRVNVAVKESAD
jgi:predicted transcriptional regulator of viral defense system